MLEKLLAAKDSENLPFLLHFSKEMKGFTTTANQDYMELMESLEVVRKSSGCQAKQHSYCIHDYGNGNKNQ